MHPADTHQDQPVFHERISKNATGPLRSPSALYNHGSKHAATASATIQLQGAANETNISYEKCFCRYEVGRSRSPNPI